MWFLTLVSLFGNLLNCLKVRTCFMLWIVCNIGWMVIDIQSGTYSRAVLDIVQMGFSIFGYVRWGKREEISVEDEDKKSM